MDINSTIRDAPNSLRLPFYCLHKFGLFSKNKFRKYLPLVIFGFILINTIVVAIIQFTNIKKDITEFVRNLEVVFGFGQVFGKLILLTYNEDTFLKLLRTTKAFRTYEGFLKQAKQNSDNDDALRRLIDRMQRTFLLSALTCLVLMIIRSVAQNVPTVGIWTLEGYEVFRRIAFIQIALAATLSAFLLWAVSGVYLGFCAEIVVQFRILCRNLKEMGDERINVDGMKATYLNQIKTCIQHHQLILEFVKNYQRAFSLLLLIEYSAVSPLSCLELLAVSESLLMENKAINAIVFLTITLQLCYYCIPANYIESEALEVANAVYFSKWYLRSHPSLKQPVMLMIKNAQNGITIKAGGIVTFNAYTVLNVLKIGWSACSIVRGTKLN